MTALVLFFIFLFIVAIDAGDISLAIVLGVLLFGAFGLGVWSAYYTYKHNQKND